MLSIAVQYVINWLGLLSPILIPGGLVLAMWISLSHRGDFALTWKEKLLRMIIFFGVLVVLAFVIFFVSTLGQQPFGWDDTAV